MESEKLWVREDGNCHPWQLQVSLFKISDKHIEYTATHKTEDAILSKVAAKMCSYCRDERMPCKKDGGGYFHEVARGGDLGGTEPCKALACHEIRALKTQPQGTTPEEK